MPSLDEAAGRELTLLRTVRDLERDVREARHPDPNLFKGLLRERLRAEGVRLLDSQGPEQTMRDQLAALFDADYYAAQHPGSSRPRRVTFEHYVERTDGPLMRAPHRSSTPCGTSRSTGCAAAGIPAVDHYLVFGESEGDPTLSSTARGSASSTRWTLCRASWPPHPIRHRRSSGGMTPARPSTPVLPRSYPGWRLGRIALSITCDGPLKGRDPVRTSTHRGASRPMLTSAGTAESAGPYLTFGLGEPMPPMRPARTCVEADPATEGDLVTHG